MISNFHQYSQYFDLLYSEKDYRTETEYVDKHIKALSGQASTLLELGSGTGNHAQYFSEAGYSVTGIERSSEMASISQRKNIPGFNAITGDMSSFNLDTKFDVAISLFHSLCYLTTNEELINCFNLVYKHLNKSGLFCFDFWYGPGVLTDPPSTRVKRLNHENLQIVRIAETVMQPERNVAIVNYEMIVTDASAGITQTIREQHPMRYFSIPEIDMLCRQTGFRLIRSESFMNGSVPGLNNWNVFSLLQKID